MDELTSEDEIKALAGETGVELRADDDDEADLVVSASTYAGGEVEMFCQGRYTASSLQGSQWVRNAATHFAVEWFALRRYNSVPEAIARACDRYRQQLQLVQEGRATIPGGVRSRRAVTVTNFNTDQRRFNNQTRVDRSRSTGVATGYTRPVDDTAPDER